MNTRQDRRDFFKAAGGAAITASVIGTGMVSSSEAVAKEHNQRRNEEMKIEVNHEWGTLKEVVCGIPNFMVPDPLPKSV